MPRQVTPVAGEIPKGKPKPTELPYLVGKTIQAVASTTVPGAYGDEPCILLYFTDGTRYGFVLPQDE